MAGAVDPVLHVELDRRLLHPRPLERVAAARRHRPARHRRSAGHRGAVRRRSRAVRGARGSRHRPGPSRRTSTSNTALTCLPRSEKLVCRTGSASGWCPLSTSRSRRRGSAPAISMVRSNCPGQSLMTCSLGARCFYRGPPTSVLVEALLRRNADGDVQQAQAAIDRLAAVPTEPGFVLHELPLLRAACAAGPRPRGRDRLSRLSGPLPRDGDIAGLRGAYGVGRGNAMTVVSPEACAAVSRNRPHSRRPRPTPTA